VQFALDSTNLVFPFLYLCQWAFDSAEVNFARIPSGRECRARQAVSGIAKRDRFERPLRLLLTSRKMLLMPYVLC